MTNRPLYGKPYTGHDYDDLGAPIAAGTVVDAQALGQEITHHVEGSGDIDNVYRVVEGDAVPFASLPYAGTSGFSGTDASMDRALTRDKTGKTGKVQASVLDAAAATAFDGITIKDLRAEFPQEHHGTLSGALTALHQDRRLARLAVKRDRCSVYVIPVNIFDRDTLDPAKPRKRAYLDIDPIEDNGYWIGAEVKTLLMSVDEVVVRKPRR